MNTYSNQLVFSKRGLGEIGLDLYFYNLRTLMIYEYEVLYQMTEGVWSSSRYPMGHSDPWIRANLHLTNGKENSRNVVEIGCNIVKNDYNLKRILNISTSYDRIKSIGKICESLKDDVDSIKVLLNEGFHEDKYIDPDQTEYSDELFNEAMESLTSSGKIHSVQLLDEDIIRRYIEFDYTDQMIRDDLGMIQNTMRNTMSLSY